VDGIVASANARLFSRAELAGVTPRPETSAALNELRTRADAYFADTVGSTSVRLDGNRQAVRTGEVAVANMYADAVREATGAQIALLSAGYVGGDVPAGAITRRQLLEITRVDTRIVTKSMTGSQLVDLIGHTARTLPAASGEFLHVSGASFALDLAAAQRVHSVSVAGAPLDPARSYLVAIPAGAADFPGAREVPTVADHGSATPMLEAYLGRNSPVSPRLEGRIVFAATPVPPVDEDTDPSSPSHGADGDGGASDAGAVGAEGRTTGTDAAPAALASSGGSGVPGAPIGFALVALATGAALLLAARRRVRP